MPYAEGRIFNDSDSHIMETKDWLAGYADPEIRPKLAPLDLTMAGGKATDDLVTALPSIIARRKADPAAMARAEAHILERKSWHALGGFDPAERSRALDLLGYHRQLVFPGSSINQFYGELGVRRTADPQVIYGGARALNRAMADFCSHDRRLRAVGFIPLDIPELAVREIREGARRGCSAFWVSSVPPPAISPTHPDMDPVWATFQELDLPFVTHGSGALFLREAFSRNGKAIETGPLGGTEEIRSRDYMGAHYASEAFMSAMILDGVFEKFPRLRAGVIEQGAMWVVPWLRKLDIAQDAFRRFEAYLNLPLRASDYARRQIKATPFPPEPVGWMIEQAGPAMFLFSTDFPHPEGGRDPLRRYRQAMADYNIAEAAQHRFYTANFNELLGSHA
jgi:predicted TIM-barrel fold metal-dependent hydrolase